VDIRIEEEFGDIALRGRSRGTRKWFIKNNSKQATLFSSKPINILLFS
jgi:hypothetical protein